MKIRLHSEAKILILLSAMHSIIGTFFGTFLIAYIMQISDNEAVSLSIYNIAFYATIAVGFLLLADYVKRKNKMFIYRFSVISQAILLIAIATLGDKISPYIAIFGAGYGMAMAFRHCPFNIMVGEKITKRMMIPFSGYKATIGGIVAIATPALLGLFISAGSYTQMAVAMLFFLAIEYLLSFFIQSKNVCQEKFGLKCFLSNAKRSILMRRVYLVEFLSGLSDYGPMSVVATMYTVYLFQSNMSLGILTSIFAFTTIVMDFFLGRYGKANMFPKFLVVANIMMGAAAIGFFFLSGKPTFIFYQFASATALKFMNRIKNINWNNASGSACVSKENHRSEFYVASDVILGFGRVLSFLILFTIGASGNMELLKHYLIAMIILVLIAGRISIKVCRNCK